MPDSGELLAAKFEAIFPHLDERQRRLLMGAEARVLGHGGIRVVARAAGVREATVSLGAGELEAGTEPLGRARKPGGGQRGHQEEGAGRQLSQWRPGMAAEGGSGPCQGPRLPRPGAGQGDPVRDYDLAADTGWVNVGTDHDTAA